MIRRLEPEFDNEEVHFILSRVRYISKDIWPIRRWKTDDLGRGDEKFSAAMSNRTSAAVCQLDW